LRSELKKRSRSHTDTRARAARELVWARELDPAVALSYVCWPSPRLAALSSNGKTHIHSEETRRRALEIVDAGHTQREVGRELGVPRPTVARWVQRRNGREVTAG
jgi:hypothetical protein